VTGSLTRESILFSVKSSSSPMDRLWVQEAFQPATVRPDQTSAVSNLTL
jgi:hypothetical protein